MNDSQDQEESPLFYPEMPRKELIDYCEKHCRNGGNFDKRAVAQMIQYAGCPEDFPSPLRIVDGPKGSYPMSDRMQYLVRLARERGNSET